MDYVTQAQWQELEARVARLEEGKTREQGTGNREQDNSPLPPSLLATIHPGLREEKSPYDSPLSSERSEGTRRGVGGEVETLWRKASFAAQCAFLRSLLEGDSPEWVALLEQAEALETLRNQSVALENWLMQYPALFADVVEKLAQVPEPQETEERVAAELLSEFHTFAEAQYRRLGIEWILPKTGSPATIECEIVGVEASAAPTGTTARCVRRGFRREGNLVLAAQVTRSNGQMRNTPSISVPEIVSPEVPSGQTEAFTPSLGDAFDEATMEIVGARRTAHAHEANTVARVETPGMKNGKVIVTKAQVLIYRMGAGQ